MKNVIKNYQHNQEALKSLLPLMKKKYDIKSIEMDSVMIRLNGKDDIEITTSHNIDQFHVHIWFNEKHVKDYVRVNKDELIPMLEYLIKLYGMGYYNRLRSYGQDKEYNAWYK